MISPEGRKQLVRLQKALPGVAKKYEGTAILAPSAMTLAKSIDLHNSQLYKGGTSRYGWVLETITGLQEVHRGIILGETSGVTSIDPEELPEIKEPVDLERLTGEIESQNEEDRIRLIGRFAK